MELRHHEKISLRSQHIFKGGRMIHDKLDYITGFGWLAGIKYVWNVTIQAVTAIRFERPDFGVVHSLSRNMQAKFRLQADRNGRRRMTVFQ